MAFWLRGTTDSAKKSEFSSQHPCWVTGNTVSGCVRDNSLLGHQHACNILPKKCPFVYIIKS